MDDFELLFIGVGNGYSVHAHCHLAGDATEPLSASEVAAIEQASAKMGQEIADAVTVGKLLYRCAFKGSIRPLFEQAVKVARERSGVRLLLKLNPADRLQRLPWEMLHSGCRFLANDIQTPVVRYVERDRPCHASRPAPPLRVLFTAACPAGATRLDLETEERRVREALANPRQVRLEVERRLSPERLEYLLNNAEKRGEPFHVWHHAGHGGLAGSGEADFVLELEYAGRSAPVGTEQLATLLAGCPGLGLLVLNVCHGAAEPGLATAAACRSLPSAIGFHTRIEDRAALVFAGSFYRDLLRWPLEVALTQARLRLAFEGSHPLNWSMPRLFSRALPPEAG